LSKFGSLIFNAKSIEIIDGDAPLLHNHPLIALRKAVLKKFVAAG